MKAKVFLNLFVILLHVLFMAHADEIETKTATVNGITYTYADVTFANTEGVMLVGGRNEAKHEDTPSPGISPVPSKLKIPKQIEGKDVIVIGQAAFAYLGRSSKMPL